MVKKENYPSSLSTVLNPAWYRPELQPNEKVQKKAFPDARNFLPDEMGLFLQQHSI